MPPANPRLELDAALKSYEQSLRRTYSCYTEFELEKLKVADAFLTASGLATSIDESQCCARDATKSARPAKKKFIGFVYTMVSRRTGFIKIGFSKSPEARERTLQSQDPMLEILRTWPGCMATEKFLHQHFAAKRVRGEWFSLSKSDLKTLNSLVMERQESNRSQIP